MATNFPTSLDTPTNPSAGNALNSPSHSSQHINTNDAIVALEAKVGVNSSAVTTSHDYKLGEVTSTDKAVGKTATQTLTNKTLTAPQINMNSDATGDMLYRASSGSTTRLPIGTSGQILNVDGTGIPAWIANPAAADATYAVKGVRVLDANAVYYAADAGSNDSYAITLSPAPSAYAVGQKFSFKANTVNTGAATLNVNSLGAKTIVKYVNTTLADGDIAAGQFVTVIYDGTNFVLQNPVANVPLTTAPLSQQDIPMITSGTILETTKLCTDSTKNILIVAYSITGGSMNLNRYDKDSRTGQWWLSYSVTGIISGGSTGGGYQPVIVGNYVYLPHSYSGIAACLRFDLADLTNQHHHNKKSQNNF